MKKSQGSHSKPDRRTKTHTLKKYALLSSLFWCAVICLSFLINYQQRSRHVIDIGITIARSSFNKDILYQRWNASHGGLYTKQIETTPPNQYLKEPDRDLESRLGEPLTMINPAYMTRQVHEIGANENGIQGHLTSLNPIRPGNQPDSWERQALKKMEQGIDEVSSIEILNGQPHLRYLHSLITEQGCLKCHRQQGYKVGQVRGGISQSVPMALIEKTMEGSLMSLWGSHAGTIFIGLVFIWVAFGRLKLAEDEVKKLQGIIPICMHCKGIRDDKGAWNRLEEYIESYSEAQLSHGLCDKCLVEQYGEKMAERVSKKLADPH